MVYSPLPKTPKYGKMRGFGGPQTPPQNNFWVIFYHPIILFGLSAFQGRFIFHFHMILRYVMILLRKTRFLGRNLGIFRVFYIVKSVSHECPGRATEVHFRGGIKEMKVA